MAITVPAVYTPISDQEVKFNRPVTEETVRKLVRNSNLFGKLATPGQVVCVAHNIPGVQNPNPDFFQEADGSEITNEFSPLKTVVPDVRHTPDLTSLYIRGAPDRVSDGVGGQATVDLSHTHAIGDAVNGPQINDGSDSPNYITPTHNHDLAANLSASESLEPSHQQVAMYLQINR